MTGFEIEGCSKMKKIFIPLFVVLSSFADLSAADRITEEPVFSGTVYQCKIFDRYRKDSGFMKLTADGKTLFISNRIYASCKGPDGKNIALAEQSDPQYKWENNILTNEKFLIPRNAKDGTEKYAEVKRKITFGQNKIAVEITVKNLRDITFPNTWQVFTENLALVTDSVKGMRAEGILPDDQKISTVIPRKYDRKKWGFGKYIKQLKLTDSEKIDMTVTSAPDCMLLLNHYGGKNMGLKITPSVRKTELDRKAGTETKIGFAIEFGKP